MKKVIVACLIGLGLAFYIESKSPYIANAYTEVTKYYSGVVSASVSISTTPTLLASTAVNRDELRIWNYGSDTIYISFGTTASSTTAATDGIKALATNENHEYLSIPADNQVKVYATLAADSGTSSLRIMTLGQKVY